MKNKHLSLENRFEIENLLREGKSFKEIAKVVNKNCTTISREIRSHYTVKNSGTHGRAFNNCLNRLACPIRKNCNLHKCIDVTSVI